MCKHKGCKCGESIVKRGDQTYCSEKCAEIQTSGKHEKSCPCGHASCGKK